MLDGIKSGSPTIWNPEKNVWILNGWDYSYSHSHSYSQTIWKQGHLKSDLKKVRITNVSEYQMAEFQIPIVFKWSEDGQYPNGPDFEWWLKNLPKTPVSNLFTNKVAISYFTIQKLDTKNTQFSNVRISDQDYLLIIQTSY